MELLTMSNVLFGERMSVLQILFFLVISPEMLI